jgi:hypothetical protein
MRLISFEVTPAASYLARGVERYPDAFEGRRADRRFTSGSYASESSVQVPSAHRLKGYELINQ